MGKGWVGGWGLALVGMLFGPGCGAGVAQTVERGVAYLVGAQRPDGSWASDEVRSAQATAEALRALAEAGAAPLTRTAAISYLTAAPIEDNDDRARRVVALAAAGVDASALADDLLLAAHDDGGWGLADVYGVDAIDSALGVAAAAAPPGLPLEEQARAFRGLVAQQNVDGGWPCAAVAGRRTDSEVYCTGLALAAIAELRGFIYAVPQIESAAGFVAAQRALDGSFGTDDGPRLVRTAAAALGLVAAGRSAAELRATELWLLAAQAADGSWGHDPFTTALALRAVAALAAQPFCGDGVAEPPFEACDGLDLGGRSCASFGLGTGTLACNAACSFDTSGCSAAPSCGDGVINRPEEQCDGADLGGRTCASLGLGGGDLSCTSTCRLKTTLCSSTGEVSPPVIELDNGSPLCSGQPVTLPVALTLPPDAAVDKVDVFFLMSTMRFSGDTFSPLHDTEADTFVQTMTKAQQALPNVSFGFGAGHFDDFGGPQPLFYHSGIETSRPFVLRQPIVGPEIPDRNLLVESGVRRMRPRGSSPLSPHEALWQIATGAGFDGDGDGSRLGSGPAGALATQTSPGTSGDVPPFSSNVAISSGTLGGVGFRAGALPIVVMFSDWCPIAPYAAGAPIPASLTGAGGVVVSSRPFSCIDSVTLQPTSTGFVSDALHSGANTVAQAVVPRGAATIPQTTAELVARGISVIGLVFPSFTVNPNPTTGTNTPTLFTAAMAKLTGAVSSAGLPLVANFRFGADPGSTQVADAIRQVVEHAGGAARPRDVALDAAGVPAGLAVAVAPAVRTGVVAGQVASFDVTLSGVPAGQRLVGSFTLRFGDATSGQVLGTIPVSVSCLPAPEPPVDADGDGDPVGVDCDDTDPEVNLSHPEIPGNGKNDDCNAATPDEIPTAAAVCTLASDLPRYGATDVAHFTGRVENLTATSTLSGLAGTLAVRPLAGGAAVATFSQTLAVIGPREFGELTEALPIAGLAPGAYAAELEIATLAGRVALCALPFEIESSAATGAGLVGTLAVEPAVRFVGEPATVRWSLGNGGNAAVDLSAELTVVELGSGLPAHTLATPLALEPGITHAATATLATATLAPGRYLVALAARLVAGGDVETLASAPFELLPVPNVDPVCTGATATPDSLWPPNHRLVPIAIGGVSDADGDPVEIGVLSVFQDEPTAPTSDGSTCPDATGIGTGTASVRSERKGGGDGRVYHVRFRALDGRGGSCDGEVTVCVRHSNGGHGTCVDQGPLFDSTICR